MDRVDEMPRIDEKVMSDDGFVGHGNMENDFIKYTISSLSEESLNSIKDDKKKSIDFIFAKIKTQKFCETVIMKQLSELSLEDVTKMSDENSHKLANELLTAVKKFAK